jgi:hypothetical protein
MFHLLPISGGDTGGGFCRVVTGETVCSVLMGGGDSLVVASGGEIPKSPPLAP